MNAMISRKIVSVLCGVTFLKSTLYKMAYDCLTFFCETYAVTCYDSSDAGTPEH